MSTIPVRKPRRGSLAAGALGPLLSAIAVMASAPACDTERKAECDTSFRR